MIRKLTMEGITVFPTSVSFSFVPGINVIVGGNDSGKSHLMKLCYALSRWGMGSAKRDLPEKWAEERRLRQSLLRVFGTHDLTGLTARGRGKREAHVHASLEGEKVPPGCAELDFQFCAGHEEEGLQINTLPQRYLQESAVFLSPKEVLSIYPCYMQAGKRYPELLDSASWELCRALEQEPHGEPENQQLRSALSSIEKMLHGRLCRHNGRFYLKRGREEEMELNLVAEGFKRIGSLGLLLGNGSIREGSSLFWDEPEMNLNATHIPQLVDIMMKLCHAGVQISLSTHSLFLLRELVIQLAQSRNKCVSRRYFGLQTPGRGQRGERVMAGNSLTEIGSIDSLEAEMEQADRYLNMDLSSDS